MKYFPKPSKMPLDSTLSSSLQSWLGHELEMRGIDAVVYTRYILSILQQDSFDADLGEREFFPLSKKNPATCATFATSATLTATPKGPSLGPGANVSPLKIKCQKAKKVDRKCTGPDMSSEERKKCAAVECLRSVSDEDSGIEGLVDELCLKLKEQNIGEEEKPTAEKVVDQESSDSVISTSPDDAAERYYAAFPALCDKGDLATAYSATPAVETTWSRVAQKSSTEDDLKTGDGETNDQMVTALVTDILDDEDVPEVYSQTSAKPKRVGGQRPGRTGLKSPAPRNTSNNHKKSPNNHWRRYGGQKTVGGARQSITFYEGFDDDQINTDWNQRMFRGRSQERSITAQQWSPVFGRKNSCPDFSGFAQPAFIIPRVCTNNVNILHNNHQYIAPLGCEAGTWYPVSPGKISLQEIFGTDEISEIEPCKTLVVDGQLVRLCATSVNSNKLSQQTNLSLKEAPMEELVAHKLWQEVEAEQAGCTENTGPDAAPAPVEFATDDVENDKNMLQDVEVLEVEVLEDCEGNVTEEAFNLEGASDGDDSALEQNEEDPVWYTGPMDIIDTFSPVHTGSRLYKRYSTGESQPQSAMTTPTCNLLWEEVWDDSGVYIGAKLKENTLDEGEDEEENLDFPFLRDMDMIAESSTDSDADYIDMSGSSHVPSLKKPCDVAIPFEPSLFPEAQVTQQGHRSPERLQIFKELAGDSADLPICECETEDVTPETKIPTRNHEQKHFVSQYKGCLTPEITQNKVPDDRPVFFLDEPELNNNNHHQHSASAKNNEQINLVTTSCTVSNLLGESSVPSFPYLTSSSSPPSAFDIPSTASAHTASSSPQWSNTSSFGHLFHAEDSRLEEVQRSTLSQALFSQGLPANDLYNYNWFTSWSSHSVFTMESSYMPKLSLSSFSCSDFSFITDSIWRDPPIAPPSKIWDINVSQKIITRESPLESAGSLNDITKYVLNLNLDISSVGLLKASDDTNFIEGGLYGGGLITDDAWSVTRSDCSEDEGICDQEENIYHFPLSPIFNLPHHKTLSVDHLDTWFCDKCQDTDYLEAWTNKLTSSMELLPSEGSAFSRESLPTRLPYLPHVQSEPSMSPRQPVHKWGENKYRLVQVKHLYKPDTSILRHLGLASEAEEQEDGKHRQATPEHHFKPITTPVVPAAAVPKPADVSKKVENCNYVILDGVSGPQIEEDTVTLTDSVGYTADLLEDLGALSSSMRSASGSLYQPYQGEETVNVSFVPKFKICRENKYIQTGESPMHTSFMTERGFDRDLTERLLTEVLNADEDVGVFEHAAAGLTDPELKEEVLIDDGITLQGPQLTEVQLYSQYDAAPSPASIARLWGESSVTSEGCQEACEDNPEMTSSMSSIDAANNISSIWCYKADDLPDAAPKDCFWESRHEDPNPQDLPDNQCTGDLDDAPSPESEATLTAHFLEEFISRPKMDIPAAHVTLGNNGYDIDQDCEDLLKDLQLLGIELPADETFSSCDEATSDGEMKPTGRMPSPIESCPISIPCHNNNMVNQQNSKEKKSSANDWRLDVSVDWHSDLDDSQNSDGEKMMFAMDAFEIPNKQGHYSSVLEEKWQLSDNSFKVQLPLKKTKFKGSNIGFSTKPCTYFLEGSCQRTDCRYSHDTSLITCRFWEEGDCFKGITCPFLHGYPGAEA